MLAPDLVGRSRAPGRVVRPRGDMQISVTADITEERTSRPRRLRHTGGVSASLPVENRAGVIGGSRAPGLECGSRPARSRWTASARPPATGVAETRVTPTDSAPPATDQPISSPTEAEAEEWRCARQ